MFSQITHWAHVSLDYDFDLKIKLGLSHLIRWGHLRAIWDEKLQLSHPHSYQGAFGVAEWNREGQWRGARIFSNILQRFFHWGWKEVISYDFWNRHTTLFNMNNILHRNIALLTASPSWALRSKSPPTTSAYCCSCTSLVLFDINPRYSDIECNRQLVKLL